MKINKNLTIATAIASIALAASLLSPTAQADGLDDGKFCVTAAHSEDHIKPKTVGNCDSSAPKQEPENKTLVDRLSTVTVMFSSEYIELINWSDGIPYNYVDGEGFTNGLPALFTSAGDPRNDRLLKCSDSFDFCTVDAVVTDARGNVVNTVSKKLPARFESLSGNFPAQALELFAPKMLELDDSFEQYLGNHNYEFMPSGLKQYLPEVSESYTLSLEYFAHNDELKTKFGDASLTLSTELDSNVLVHGQHGDVRLNHSFLFEFVA